MANSRLQRLALIAAIVLLGPVPSWAIQCAVPISDRGVGSWTLETGGGAAGAFDELDEDTACTGADDGDTTNWNSGNNPDSTSELDLNLTSLTDPGVSTGHVLRWTGRKNNANGRQIDCTIELRQAGSTLHATCSNTQANIGNTNTDFSYTAPAACADAITDYGDLECVIDCTDVGGGPGRRAFMTSCSLEVPDAPASGKRRVMTMSVGDD